MPSNAKPACRTAILRARYCRATAWSLLGSCALASSAFAIPMVDLNGRDADIHLSTISGGVGTAAVSITPAVGSLTSNDLAPSFLQIAGNDTVSAESGPFTATLVADWNLKQDYSIANAVSSVVIDASGSIAVLGSSFGAVGGVPSVGPFIHEQHNYQTLHFSLTEDTAYTISGSTWGDEYIDLFGGPQAALVFGGGQTYGPGDVPAQWSFSGTLAAGDYVIRNRLIPLGNSGWDYSLTLVGAQVAAVPEPETYALMLAGLSLMVLVARRREA